MGVELISGKIMSDSSKTQKFLQKLAPCIKRGELENCVEVAGEMGIGAVYQ